MDSITNQFLVVTKPGLHAVFTSRRRRRKRKEVMASLADVKEVRVDAAPAILVSELERIFTLKEVERLFAVDDRFSLFFRLARI